MSIVHRCDKCKKITVDINDMWIAGNTYIVKTKQKINKEDLIMNVSLSTTTGLLIDLCNKCANKLLKKAISSFE